MKIQNPKSKIQKLRTRYPQFFYQEYSYKFESGNLKISFDFALRSFTRRRVSSDIKFTPKIVIKNVSKKDLDRVGEPVLKNLVFHLGLMEIPSYWKATCSPQIIVEAGHLTKQQIAWWHDLILKGMGEFFYQNKINFTPHQSKHGAGQAKPNFLTLTTKKSHYDSHGYINETTLYQQKLKKRTLIPVGGGKDAVVTLEILKKSRVEIRPFILNPKQEQLAIVKLSNTGSPLIVERTIDPKLLELNRQGYLNGHTPFSAYLAFLTTLCAALFDYKYIALSNERSSNEGNVKYLGRMINHQYSKSFEFEKKFRQYSKKYLAKDIEYFSFLRPLYELQIAKIFAKFPKYFPVFLSCNEAHKTKSGTRKPTGKWCGKCSKCLFIFAALYPFVKEKQLIKIFKKNLFEDKTLIPLMEQLVGKRGFKPFECVGTIKESKIAFSLSLGKKKDHKIFHSWNTRHFLPPQFERILKKVA